MKPNTYWILTLALLAPTAAAAAPSTVSPGGRGEFLTASSGCPTFSWGGPAAGGYELAVFELPAGAETSSSLLADLLESAPLRLGARLPAGATSWTPPADRCLEPGGRYAWFVRGSESDEWSTGRFFEVAPETELERAVARVLTRFLAQRRISPAEASAFAETLMTGSPGSGPPAGSSAAPGTRAAPPTINGDAALLANQSDASGITFGVKGVSNSTDAGAAGLLGYTPGTTGEIYGVRGVTESESGKGVAGEATAGSGVNYGVYGSTISEEGRGVHGVASNTGGTNYGVRGASHSKDGYGGYFVSEADEGTALFAGAKDEDGVDLLLGSNDGSDGDGVIASAGDLSLQVGSGKTIKLGSDDVSVDDAGNVTATQFIGGGSLLTGVPGPDSVGTLEIINDSVTTADIKNGTILFSDMADNGCATNEVMEWNGSVWVCSPPTLGTGVVTTTQILDGTIQAVDIGTGAVTTTQILDGTIQAADIGTGAVTSTQILDSTIQAGDIGTGAVAGDEILNGSVTGTDISDGTIDGSEIDAISAIRIQCNGDCSDLTLGQACDSYVSSGEPIAVSCQDMATGLGIVLCGSNNDCSLVTMDRSRQLSLFCDNVTGWDAIVYCISP